MHKVTAQITYSVSVLSCKIHWAYVQLFIFDLIFLFNLNFLFDLKFLFDLIAFIFDLKNVCGCNCISIFPLLWIINNYWYSLQNSIEHIFLLLFFLQVPPVLIPSLSFTLLIHFCEVYQTPAMFTNPIYIRTNIDEICPLEKYSRYYSFVKKSPKIIQTFK